MDDYTFFDLDEDLVAIVDLKEKIENEISFENDKELKRRMIELKSVAQDICEGIDNLINQRGCDD